MPCISFVISFSIPHGFTDLTAWNNSCKCRSSKSVLVEKKAYHNCLFLFWMTSEEVGKSVGFERAKYKED